MKTQTEWIHEIANKQINDNCNAGRGRINLWLYCNVQTVVIVLLCFHANWANDSVCDCGHEKQHDRKGTKDGEK